jgi:hypothetical protein
MTSCTATATALNVSTLAPKALYLSILNALGFTKEIAAFRMPAVQDAQDVHVLGV